MTAVAERAAQPVATSGVDRLSTWTAALLMPIGPAAVAVLRFVLPYSTPDSARTAVGKIAAHPGAENAVLWLFLVAVFTLVPGAYTAIRMARPTAPRLAAAAGALLIPGYLALIAGGAGTSIDFVGYVGVTHGFDHATLGALLDKVDANPVLVILAAVFVVGHIAGTILLAIALGRGRVVAAWAALALGVSQPLHLAAAMSGNHPLDLLGWGLTAVGMGAAAVRLTRTS